MIKRVWQAFFEWWNIHRNAAQGNGNFCQIIKLVKGVELQMAWTTSVIALLRTIWLARNELIYGKKKWEGSQLIWLTKIRAFKWILAADKINIGLEQLWEVNPRGACLHFNKKHCRMDYIWCNSTAIGFSDGSWKIAENGSKRSGIGGCITDLEGNLIFIFSGPSSANNPLETEREALLFLFQKFKEIPQVNGVFTLYIDSRILVGNIC